MSVEILTVGGLSSSGRACRFTLCGRGVCVGRLDIRFRLPLTPFVCGHLPGARNAALDNSYTPPSMLGCWSLEADLSVSVQSQALQVCSAAGNS